MTTITDKIQMHIQNDSRVLVSGEPGMGKVANIKQAVDNLGLTMKTYSASTFDRIDLVGFPVPQSDSTVSYVRADEAEVIFIDDFDRANASTRNFICELVQFGTISGKKLPNLRCVVVSVTPASEMEQLFVNLFDSKVEVG